MLNVLRLKDGVPATYFAERTGLSLAAIAHQLEAAVRKGLLDADPTTAEGNAHRLGVPERPASTVFDLMHQIWIHRAPRFARNLRHYSCHCFWQLADLPRDTQRKKMARMLLFS